MAKQRLSGSGFDYMLSQQDLLGIFKQSGSNQMPYAGRFGVGKALSIWANTFTDINIAGFTLDTGQYPSSYTRGAICLAPQHPAALAGNLYVRVSADGVAAQLTFHINIGAQTWAVYRGTLTGTLLASGTSLAITNIGATFIPIQIGWEISDTVGRIYLRVNGTVLSDGTTNFDTNNAGGAVWNRVSVGSGDSTYVAGLVIDDVVVFNMDTDAFSTLPRDARFYVGVPTSDSAVQWAPNSGTNFAAAATNDTDTLYNSSSTVGQEDLFNVSATWVPNGSAIYGPPQLVRRSRIDDATPRDVKSALKSNATTAYGATTAEFSSYTIFVDEIALDPNGNIAWTLSALQAVDIGYNLVA